MSLTDKEIALELTKAYLEHLSVRANSDFKNKSHADVGSVEGAYKAFYSTVSSVGKTSAEK